MEIIMKSFYVNETFKEFKRKNNTFLTLHIFIQDSTKLELQVNSIFISL